MMHEKVQRFIAKLPPLQNDSSFEVRWSLSELEDIVFEFINAHDLPPEFKVPSPFTADSASKVSFAKESPKKKPVNTDVNREDLMNVKRSNQDDNLPQMVRDYILHDRGNSLFLGDSFGNLPSPVAESPTIKKLFKFNEDEPIDRRKKNESKN